MNRIFHLHKAVGPELDWSRTGDSRSLSMQKWREVALHAFLLILVLQVAGEALSRSLGLPIPGPLVGMILLIGLCVAVPAVAAVIRPVVQALLSHLSILFVPAGAGVVGHFATLGDKALVIVAATVGSTVLAIAAAALTFAVVARLTGSRDD